MNRSTIKTASLTSRVSPEKAPDEPTYVTIHFEKGVPTAVDGEELDAVSLVEKLNKLGGENGIGLLDIVENRLVGMKSRGVYETPGGTILYKAHELLEMITLDRDTSHYKKLVAEKYGEARIQRQMVLTSSRSSCGFCRQILSRP